MASYKAQVKELESRSHSYKMLMIAARDRAAALTGLIYGKDEELIEQQKDIERLHEIIDKAESELSFVNDLIDRLAENYLDKPIERMHVSQHGMIYSYSPAERLGMFLASAQIG
jgi:uncharacterized coiled-coil DUF342 family protein